MTLNMTFFSAIYDIKQVLGSGSEAAGKLHRGPCDYSIRDIDLHKTNKQIDCLLRYM